MARMGKSEGRFEKSIDCPRCPRKRLIGVRLDGDCDNLHLDLRSTMTNPLHRNRRRLTSSLVAAGAGAKIRVICKHHKVLDKLI